MVEPANKILKALLELIPKGVAVLDANHQVIDFNPALVKILGISKEGLRAPGNMPISDIFAWMARSCLGRRIPQRSRRKETNDNKVDCYRCGTTSF